MTQPDRELTVKTIYLLFRRGFINCDEAAARIGAAGVPAWEVAKHRERLYQISKSPDLRHVVVVDDKSTTYMDFANHSGVGPYVALVKFNGDIDLYDCIGPACESELRRYYNDTYGAGPDGIAYYRKEYVS